MPLPASPKAFYPDERKINELNQCETSISWEDGPQSLVVFIKSEEDNTDFGNIKHGIFHIDNEKAQQKLEKDGYSEYVTVDHRRDPNSNNPYHGNICFNANYFYTIDPGGRRRPQRHLLDIAAWCFVNAQIKFIPPTSYRNINEQNELPMHNKGDSIS